MKIYPNLFAYLNGCQAGASNTDVQLQARDRPIITLAKHHAKPFLIPLATETTAVVSRREPAGNNCGI